MSRSGRQGGPHEFQEFHSPSANAGTTVFAHPKKTFPPRDVEIQFQHHKRGFFYCDCGVLFGKQLGPRHWRIVQVSQEPVTPKNSLLLALGLFPDCTALRRLHPKLPLLIVFIKDTGRWAGEKRPGHYLGQRGSLKRRPPLLVGARHQSVTPEQAVRGIHKGLMDTIKRPERNRVLRRLEIQDRGISEPLIALSREKPQRRPSQRGGGCFRMEIKPGASASLPGSCV
ncbi:hypothetical protein CC78DRAFT_586853 [Lojkania enalia]|uniref:Uncharacterized protein n=1 Tax=Lojkania enalia TaxID=147567 RepID=A0A9P4K1Z8_9PLEO|nr:hypothetical protein CC78DRAFT_586853 [Didymosphaeria enalia]